jgi:hypothetical protein
MSAPVQQSPQTPKRSRIIVSLERAREAMHLHPHGHQPFHGGAAKRRRWPIVLMILGGILLALAVGGYIYWQRYKTRPAYSLALLVDASRRGDAAGFDEVVDATRVSQSFAPQVIDEATARLGTALTPAIRQRVEALVPTLLPGVMDTVRAEVMEHIKAVTARAEGKPFFLVALYLPYLVDIKQEGDTASVSAKSGERTIELTMQRSNETRWKVVALKDSVLAKRLVDALAKELPAIGTGLGNEILNEVEKRLPGGRRQRR